MTERGKSELKENIYVKHKRNRKYIIMEDGRGRTEGEDMAAG